MPGVALLLVARVSAAQPATLPLELEWSAPPECPTGEQVQAELSRVTRARDGVQPVLHARAVITRDGDDYVLSLSTLREGERREKQGRAPECATLQSMATLILGLALGQSVELVLDGADSSDEGGEADSSAGRETKPAAASGYPLEIKNLVEEDSGTTERASRSLFEEARGRVTVSGGMASNFGLLPETAAGPTLGAGFVPRPWMVPEVALTFAALFPLARTNVGSGVTASFFAITARGVGCWASSGWKPEIAVCPLGLSGGALFAASEGTERDESVIAPWYGWTPSFRINLDFSEHARVRFEPMAVFSPFHTRFVVAELSEVHAVPFWSAGMEVALEIDVMKTRPE